MKAALIFPPFKHKKFEEDLKVVSNEFGVYPPLGLAYAAAILEKAGHEVILIDANALKLKKEEALRQVNEFKPDLLGFMLTTYMFHDTLDWIRFLKKETALPVIVGNINVDLYPEETLSYPEIDYGIIGSAQKTLPLLISCLEHKKNISHIKGLCYKKEGNVVVNKPEARGENFKTLPFPARHLLPNEKYFQYISKRKNFTILITTMGCPYKCKFCYLTNIPYSERKLDDVLKEIEECYYKHRVREIDFFEPDFTHNRERTIELCNSLIKKKLDLIWSCRSRIDQVDDELLSIMKGAGCARIYYGIESGDQEILNNNCKGITLEQIRNALAMTRKHKIKSLGFFMVGQVGDTKETIDKTIKFMKELPLDYIQVCRTIPKPKSELDSILVRETGKDYWKGYLLSKETERRIESPWTELTEEEKLEALKKMYKAFYLRPRYILRTLLSVKSFHELKRYIKGGLNFLGNQGVDLE